MVDLTCRHGNSIGSCPTCQSTAERRDRDARAAMRRGVDPKTALNADLKAWFSIRDYSAKRRLLTTSDYIPFLTSDLRERIQEC